MIKQLIAPVVGLLDKFIPNADVKQKIAFDLATLADAHAQELALAQIEVLKADAKGNWFQSSWRPLCGYICVASLAVNFLISPLAAGFDIIIPQADASVMMPILGAMLGLSGSRSFERAKGVGK